MARFPRDGDDPHSLLRSADVAMYAARRLTAAARCTPPRSTVTRCARLNVLSEFRAALDAGEIEVFYQPIMHMDGTRVHGAEGLVRWQHPELGLLPPSDFIPIVEQTELIGSLTRHVLERAVFDCARWRRGGHELTVSVDLSVRNLLDPDLPSVIGKLLTRYGLSPEALQLEITESMLMSDPDRSLVTLTALSQLGVGLSVDDYGTGYSSLANLRRLPIDELKLDRSFVSPMLSDENDLIIVRSTINLGHDLGLKVVAEGVEDEPTLTRLAALDCDLAQGYYFSKPLPVAGLRRRRRPRHRSRGARRSRLVCRYREGRSLDCGARSGAGSSSTRRSPLIPCGCAANTDSAASDACDIVTSTSGTTSASAAPPSSYGPIDTLSKLALVAHSAEQPRKRRLSQSVDMDNVRSGLPHPVALGHGTAPDSEAAG